MGQGESDPVFTDDGQSCFPDDLEFEPDGPVFDVVEVVHELLLGVLFVFSVRVHHLRPAGDAGGHMVAGVIVGDAFLELGRPVEPFGTGADKVHLAF